MKNIVLAYYELLIKWCIRVNVYDRNKAEWAKLCHGTDECFL